MLSNEQKKVLLQIIDQAQFFGKDIELILAIKEETAKISKTAAPEEWDSEGLCDECNSFSPLLKVEGRLLCPDCRDELY